MPYLYTCIHTHLRGYNQLDFRENTVLHSIMHGIIFGNSRSKGDIGCK